MKKLIFAVFLFLCVIVPKSLASAHVLITDETNTKGAILHIIPDDDPVAGEQATLYFDMQNQLSGEDSVMLTIYNSASEKAEIETKTDGSLVTANFTFPSQGVYEIEYVVSTSRETYIFKQTQRVSRGISGATAGKQTYAWAEMLLVASVISFAFLMIVAFNRRKDITRQSKS